MNYTMEELVPIVAELTKKAVGFESSSITYEKAEQFMGAVLYCIQEGEREKYANVFSGGTELDTGEKVTAKEAYEYGYQCVVDKVKSTMELYHRILVDFEDYGNLCLHDTFAKGVPEFFKWYDARFYPQNTILTLDYPVLQIHEDDDGVDAIYNFLTCIEQEQKLLNRMDKIQVKQILERYCGDAENMIENICYIVWRDIVFQMFLGKKCHGEDDTRLLQERCRTLFEGQSAKEIQEKLSMYTKKFVAQYYDGDESLCMYLSAANRDIGFYLHL